MQLQLSLAVADELHEALLVRGEPLPLVDAARRLLASANASEELSRHVLHALIAHDHRFCWREDPTARDPNGSPPRLSLTCWDVPDRDLAEVPFVALDLETTGARAGIGKITEIGAVRIEGFQEVAYFNTLVNPMRPIPPMITQITGITSEMVAGAPRIEEVIPELLRFIDGSVIVAHNAPFDVGFLNYELRRLKGRKLGDGAIDTLPLARSLAPGLPNYRLHTVADALDAPVRACHRALADARAAGYVFVTLAGRLQELGITRLDQARTYVSPTLAVAREKLGLTRDVPQAPGIYRFLDKHSQVLYVGKAEHLRERVRSYFVSNAEHGRRVREAVRMVDRIDWELTTPLEAAVREQELILTHRPPCNMQGRRPESYAYLKVGRSTLGLHIYASSRPPRWLEPSADLKGRRRDAMQPLVFGPFRGKTRLTGAIDLLHRCYPIRHCGRRREERPCLRKEQGRCLAPCTGHPDTVSEHDALVGGLLAWVAGDRAAPLDPIDKSGEIIRALCKQRRFEEAKALQDAREDLEGIRRSYAGLAEARGLRFAALWPQSGNGDGPEVRVNLVWNGTLLRPFTVNNRDAAPMLDEALSQLGGRTGSPSGADPGIAVRQLELDSLLAVRRWRTESRPVGLVTTIDCCCGPEDLRGVDEWRARVVRQAGDLLALR